MYVYNGTIWTVVSLLPVVVVVPVYFHGGGIEEVQVVV